MVFAIPSVDFFTLSPTCRDPEISLLQNLKDLLEIDFPSRAVLEKSVSCFLLIIVNSE